MLHRAPQQARHLSNSSMLPDASLGMPQQLPIAGPDSSCPCIALDAGRGMAFRRNLRFSPLSGQQELRSILKGASTDLPEGRPRLVSAGPALPTLASLRRDTQARPFLGLSFHTSPNVMAIVAARIAFTDRNNVFAAERRQGLQGDKSASTKQQQKQDRF